MALKKLWQRSTSLDRYIVVSMIVLCGLLAMMFGTGETGRTLYASRGEQVIFKADLESDQVVGLEGPLGVTEIEIRDGRARVLASPCPYKVCIGMGEIDHSGEIIACVPNRLLIEISGGDEESKEMPYDLLSR